MTTVVNSNAQSNVWSNYIDINDLKTHLQINQVNLSVDAQLQSFVDMACQWVQGYLGRPIAPTKFDRRFDGYTGWNGAYIQLPYYPVLEIASCIEYWGVSGPHVLNESTPTTQVDGFQMDYLHGMMTRIFPGNVQKPWFPGSRNIEIVWVAGYNPLPGDIRLATLEYAAHWWRNTQQAARTNIRAGGDDSDILAAGMFQNIESRLKPLLSPYLSVGMG
jgi:Phage gp6-like head-tail connector protein